jgi:hypothetical protein
MGKFCIIAESPVNIGVRMLQKSAAKMEGKRAAAAPLLALARVAKLCCRDSGMFPACHSDPTPF